MPVYIASFFEAIVSEHILFREKQFKLEMVELAGILRQVGEFGAILVPGVMDDDSGVVVPEDSAAKILKALDIPVGACVVALSLNVSSYNRLRMQAVVDAAKARVGDGNILIFIHPGVASAFMYRAVNAGQFYRLKEDPPSREDPTSRPRRRRESPRQVREHPTPVG